MILDGKTVVLLVFMLVSVVVGGDALVMVGAPCCFSGVSIDVSLFIEVDLPISPFITGGSNFPEGVVAPYTMLSSEMYKLDLTVTGVWLSLFPGV